MTPKERSKDLPPDLKISDKTREFLEGKGYKVIEKLGRGASGTVYLVEYKDGERFAVKEINTRDTNLEDVKNEVDILKKLNHGYIISYVDSFSDEEANLVYVVMELCSGNLFQLMNKQKEQETGFSEHQILDWLVQICLALQYVHQKNIIHRDIKPQNIFHTEFGYINVGDFSGSKILDGDPYAASVVGADLYVSPEVLRSHGSVKSDVWSLGWLLHDLCRLDVWSDVVKRRFLHGFSMMGTPPEISDRYSVELQELVKEMIQIDPHLRPSATEILDKPFLSDAVNRNRGVLESLTNRSSPIIPKLLLNEYWINRRRFDEAYDNHFEKFEVLVEDWKKATDELESVHHGSTAGSLSGAVIGAAGGITMLVGLILAPFTLGASLIVTGVGVGVSVAGGVTGAASNITGAVKKSTLQETISKIKQDFESESAPIIAAMEALMKSLDQLQKFELLVTESENNQVQSIFGKTAAVTAAGAPLMVLANVGRIVAQAAKAGRAAVAAMTAVSGVLSAVMLLADAAFIVIDSREIHEMRTQNQSTDPEQVKSEVLKLIIQMRNTHTDLCNVLTAIQETRSMTLKRTTATSKTNTKAYDNVC